MVRFCHLCRNMLSKSTNNNILTFVFKTCHHTEEAKPSDSLMLNISLTEEESLYRNDIYLNLAAKDQVAPLIEKNCTNCESDVVREISIMSSGESIYVCPECEHRFI